MVAKVGCGPRPQVHERAVPGRILEFTRRIGSSLLIGSAYHKNTNAKAERVNGVLGDTLRAFANGRKDDWDVWLPYAVFAINNAASTLGGDLTPSGSHSRPGAEAAALAARWRPA